jgi:hypothetical protein
MPKSKEVRAFLEQAFSSTTKIAPLSPAEAAVESDILVYVDREVAAASRPRTYVLGLALDFLLLAQKISNVDGKAKKFRPALDEKSLFARYPLVTKRGEVTANTLTLTFENHQEGIRKLEESVVSLFHGLNRLSYPSAYVYNTGQWTKYKDLLVDCFKLSEIGRLSCAQKLIEYGCEKLVEHTFFGRQSARVRLFELALMDYPRSSRAENGGLVLQAMVNGFIVADRPHLSIIADKVRTGSARQKRFGDIDCYRGLDLELSVEVKDMPISDANLDSELSGFIKNIQASTVLGLVFVQAIAESSRGSLESAGIRVLTLAEVIDIVKTWDWPKQDNALQGMLSHIAHTEQNADATTRLLQFIEARDADHDSLVYLEASSNSGS